MRTPEQMREYSRRWREKHPEYAKAARDRFRAKQSPEYRLREHLKHKFGLTLEQFRALEEAQDHRCAICRKPPIMTPINPRGRLFPDHDHRTGEVRGLLCAKCNTAIGQMDDAPDRLRRAADYLERRP